MTIHRESGLHKFSLLLNHATAAAKMAMALEPVGDETPALAAWREQAAQISTEMKKRDGERLPEPYTYQNQRHGSTPRRPPYDGCPLMAPARACAALREAVEALPSEALEAAAVQMAKHLAVPFERGGISFLAFPQQGVGIKARKTKKGIEVFDWASDWKDKAKASLPQSHLFDNTHARYQDNSPEGEDDDAVAARALGAYWAHSQIPYGQAGSLGDLAARGVHLAGKLAGSANSETPLASLDDQDVGYAMAALPGRPVPPNHDIDYHEAGSISWASQSPGNSATRRLGWLALALCVGDRLSPAQAASGHTAPSGRAETMLMLESRSVPSAEDIRRHRHDQVPLGPMPLNGVERASRPAICVMQAASTLASHDLTYAPRGGRGALEYFLYQIDAKRLAHDTKEAMALAASLDKQASLITTRAYELARQVESQWRVDQGIAQAIEDAKLLNGAAPVSAKSVNWTLANPAAAEALRKAQSNPSLGFAARSARYTGAIATDDGELVERSMRAWRDKGLDAEGFEGLAANPNCADMLAGLWQAELAEVKNKPLKKQFKAVVGLASHAMQAAFAHGGSGEQALEFASWCVERGSRHFLAREGDATRGSEIDRVGSDMPPLEICTIEQATAFHAQAAGRARAHPAVMGAVFRGFAFGEGMAQAEAADPSKRVALATKWLEQATLGSSKSPSIDWTLDLGSSWLVDLAQRSAGPLASALREARESGAHGAFAARAAIGLGIEKAADGNDLIGQAREKLRVDYGMGASGWKNLAAAPAQMVSELAAQFEARAPAVLRARAQFQTLREAAEAESGAEVGLGIGLLSWASQYGISLADATALAALGRQRPTGERSELLRHGIRPISATDEAGALFALQEAKAKAERMPRLLKTMAERMQKHEAERAKAAAPVPAIATLKAEVDLIDDWLRNTEDGVWQTLPPKATFADLMRRQAVWHEDTATREAAGETSKSKSKPWSNALSRHAQGEWSAVLAGTAADLSEEGRAMHHCVSSYSSNCKRGDSRIFSIRLNGERFSTMELRLSDENGRQKPYDHQHPKAEDKWSMAQNLGNCNARITDPSALAFCEAVVQAANDAHAAWILDLEARRSLAAKEASKTRKITTIVKM